MAPGGEGGVIGTHGKNIPASGKINQSLFFRQVVGWPFSNHQSSACTCVCVHQHQGNLRASGSVVAAEIKFPRADLTPKRAVGLLGENV
jgi:hypothetical protein